MSALGTWGQGPWGRVQLPQDRGQRVHGAAQRGCGDQNPSGIPCADPMHMCGCVPVLRAWSLVSPRKRVYPRRGEA